ncbi:hypothetical protein OG592_43525 (plasmid) [Streptomyces avidinii]|uniref:hypothetical protein n=1 Tax=Streptomyces avidinii TaxID=1895 RepID=UPI002F917247|nr:hypothetical protein OG592_43525 [Streptomyces avidinii]
MAGKKSKSEIEIKVSRLRVTYLATRIHERVTQDIALPGAFRRRLQTLEPVEGLQVTLPFEVPVDPGDVAWKFWAAAMEKDSRVRPPFSDSDTQWLFRHRMPLRHQATLTAPFESPRLEALLHPFGWIVLATADLTWQEPVPLEEAAEALDERAAQGAEVTVGSSRHQATFATAAGRAADALSAHLAGDTSSTLPGHRLVTVIDGSVNVEPTDMPPSQGAVQCALDKLSCGHGGPSQPALAFVARWDYMGNFTWNPEDLVYMLQGGTSVVLPKAVTSRPSPSAPEEDTAGRHRRFALMLAYLSANAGLIRARPHNQVLQDLAKEDANRLARLYGPWRADADYWGLEPQSYLHKTDAISDIESLLGVALEARRKPPSTYP